MNQTQGVENRYRKIMVGALIAIMIILIGAALRATYIVSMPFAFAFFLTVLLHPAHEWLKAHLPSWLRWLSLLMTMLMVILILAIAVGLIWISLGIAIDRLPQYSENIEVYWERFVRWLVARELPLPREIVDVENIMEYLISILTFTVTTMIAIISYLILIFFLALLMLLEWGDWRAKSAKTLKNGRADKVVDTVDTITYKVRRFLLVRTFISALSGIGGGLWLWALGVDLALLWGVLFFLLNFVPIIGTTISLIPPTLFAFVQHGFGWALFAVSVLILYEQVISNYLDPRLQGISLRISPTVLLVAAVFWAWAWGVPGVILAAPLMVTLIIICEHVPSLKPVAQLLSRSAEDIS